MIVLEGHSETVIVIVSQIEESIVLERKNRISGQ